MSLTFWFLLIHSTNTYQSFESHVRYPSYILCQKEVEKLKSEHFIVSCNIRCFGTDDVGYKCSQRKLNELKNAELEKEQK